MKNVKHSAAQQPDQAAQMGIDGASGGSLAESPVALLLHRHQATKTISGSDPGVDRCLSRLGGTLQTLLSGNAMYIGLNGAAVIAGLLVPTTALRLSV